MVKFLDRYGVELLLLSALVAVSAVCYYQGGVITSISDQLTYILRHAVFVFAE
jgi:hypothetical protein